MSGSLENANDEECTILWPLCFFLDIQFDRSHGRRDKGPMTSGPALMVQTSKARLG